MSTHFPGASGSPVTLHVDTGDNWWWSCQTCVPDEQPVTARTPSAGAVFPFEILLQEPGGNFISRVDPRVRLLETGYAIQFAIRGTPEDPLPAGIWQLHVAGDGSYEARIAADAGIRLSYLGPHTVPAGRPVNPEIALASKGDTHVLELVDGPLASIFLPLDGGAPLPGPDLYPGAEAGAYGFFTGGDNGVGKLPEDAYHLIIRGRLQDGTPLQRMVPAPIRARDVHLRSPAGGMALPGTTLSHTFRLRNAGTGSRSYELLAESSQAWADTGAVPPGVTLAPGETRTIAIPLHVPAGTPSGTVEETTLTIAGEDLLDSETATVQTTTVDTLHVYLSLVRND